jgi:excisionase family DNA binding protein
MDSEKLVLTVEEAGVLLGISRPHAYKLAREGQLPILRLGRRMVVPKKALEIYLAGAMPTSPQ